ncbi:MAG: methionine adenosyltransferase domain-containing protein, partial [Planctomycetota bacterium]
PEKISNAIREVFRLTPRGIIETLNLRRPIFRPTARHGHFGRKPHTENGLDFFTWEKTDKADALKSMVK